MATSINDPVNAQAVWDQLTPPDGIPRNDLHHGIRAQLDLAETALQPGILPVGTTLPAAQISDATVAGRAVLTAASASAQRTAMGAMAATLAGWQAAFDAAPAAEKAVAQASVSGDRVPVLMASRYRLGGARVVFFGCSITNGSNSTNAGATSYSPRVKALSEHLRIAECIRLGYPGQSSEYVASQLQALYDLSPTHVVIGPDFGTNSAGLTSTAGVYTAYGRFVEAVVAGCRSRGITVYACRTLPRGIEQDQYSGTAAAAGTTGTVVLPATADAVTQLVGAQIVFNGDGVVRAVRSYTSATRTLAFSPSLAAATTTSTTFVVSGAGDTHRGTGLQNLWLSQNASRLGLEIIDTYGGLIDSRGFLSASYYASADPVHPIDAGHAAIAAIISARLAALIPKVQHPATAFGSLGYAPLIQGPATAALPAGMSSISPVTMAGVKTHSIGPGPLGDAPGNVWTGVFDTTASGGGTERVGFHPSTNVAPGDVIYICGTIETVGTGTATLVLWNGTALNTASSIGASINTAGPQTFAAIATIPAGCTSATAAVQIVTTTGNSLTVKLAGLCWWNLTAIGLA